jgi:LysM repeat protein
MQKMGMPMSEKQDSHFDQADMLRKLVEQKETEQLPEAEKQPEKIPTGTLPPRSSVHPKPPVRLAPYYVAGALVLLALGGLVFWWYTVRNEPSVAQTQTKAPSEQKVPSKPSVHENKLPAPSVPTSQTKPSEANKPAPEVGKPVTPVQQKPSVKPAAAQASPAKAAPVAKKQRKILRHRVQKGDTLYGISVMYYGTAKYQSYLARYNGIEKLYAGSVIKVPIPPR